MKVKAGEELSEANAHIVCHQEPITHLSAILSTGSLAQSKQISSQPTRSASSASLENAYMHI